MSVCLQAQATSLIGGDICLILAGTSFHRASHARRSRRGLLAACRSLPHSVPSPLFHMPCLPVHSQGKCTRRVCIGDQIVSVDGISVEGTDVDVRRLLTGSNEQVFSFNAHGLT
jgi:hypothetical protein